MISPPKGQQPVTDQTLQKPSCAQTPKGSVQPSVSALGLLRMGSRSAAPDTAVALPADEGKAGQWLCSFLYNPTCLLRVHGEILRPYRVKGQQAVGQLLGAPQIPALMPRGEVLS